MRFILAGAILGVVILVFHCIAKEFSDIAEMKGHVGKKYYWYTFVFGIIGMLMVVALPNLNTIKVKNVPNTPSSSKPLYTPPKNTYDNIGKPTHFWLCNGCHQMRHQSPCEHCGAE